MADDTTCTSCGFRGGLHHSLCTAHLENTEALYRREYTPEERASFAQLAENARAIMGELRAEDPTFGMASDIPDGPEFGDGPDFEGWAERCGDIHPTGRCTCGGEGRCAWCSRPCPVCGVPTIEHGDTCISIQRGCSRCGGLENVLLLHHGWVCDFCLGGDRMPDYEALGYPETGAAVLDEPDMVDACGTMTRLSYSWVAGIVSLQEAIQKDNPSSTDIVDSGAKDSYK